SVLPEHKPRRGCSLWREIPNRVDKPADVVDDRNSAIPQAVHLVESARLGPRRYKEDVGASFDEMSELLAEVDAGADSIRMTSGKPGPQVLISRLTSPKHDPRRFQPRQLVGDRRQEIESLLIDHAGDHADERARKGCSIHREAVPPQDFPLG